MTQNHCTVTGINVHVITPIVCIVCIFYTCVVSTNLLLYSIQIIIYAYIFRAV